MSAHRGPDGSGTASFESGQVRLGHVRLAIIDLTDTGAQPMYDDTRSVCLVFNGEIYNFKTLRAQLVADGFQFRGTSDTEVLLNLYLRDGDRLFEELDGIYAFALYDGRSQEVLLARDALGVKPLYWANAQHGLVFGSEIKSVLRVADVERTIDVRAIIDTLTLLWTPGPSTTLRAVKKLEPGCAMRIRAGRVTREWRHYDLPLRAKGEEGTPRRTTTEWASRVRATIAGAVERQMIADVPVGAFLSGGLDSSSVAAFAQRAMGTRRLQCFTIDNDVEAMRSEGFSADLPYARRVAQHLGVDLHVVKVGPEMIDQLQTMLYHLDEPQADPAPLAVMHIAQLAREQGIKVLLSGTGGDDIFTGYRRHVAVGLEPFWSWLPPGVRAAAARFGRSMSAQHARGRRIGKALGYLDLEGDQRIASYFWWQSPQLAMQLLAPEHRTAVAGHIPLLQSIGAARADAETLDRMLYAECKHFLADHNLNYTDKMSMAAGVEVRVPLIDPEVVDLAFSIPIRYRQNKTTGKWIFKKAMEGILPADVIYRPKTGFGAPVRAWMSGPLKPLVEEVLSERALRKRGLFDAREVHRLRRENGDGHHDWSFLLFSLMCIELWAQMFVDQPIEDARSFAAACSIGPEMAIA